MQVDEFWHQHILDSTAYIPFCMRTAGEYIHHSPFYEKSHAFHAPCFKHTKQVYLSKYNEEPNREIWATMGESGGGCGGGCGDGDSSPGSGSCGRDEFFCCFLFLLLDAGIVGLIVLIDHLSKK